MSMSGAGTPRSGRLDASELVGCGLPGHVVVEAALGDAEPQDLLVAEGLPRVIDLLELRVLRRVLGPQLLRRGDGGVLHRLREGQQTGAAAHRLRRGPG